MREYLQRPGAKTKSEYRTNPFKSSLGCTEKHAEATGTINSEEPIGGTTYLESAQRSITATTISFTNGMRIPPCLALPSQKIEILKSAMKNPPVTVSTLGELNLTWMMHYVNLRCDINFDHNLHFTPIKGQRGKEKRSQAVEYWCALEAEFRIYQHRSRRCSTCESDDSGTSEVFQPRLPTMFQDLKDLLETLVPDKDHDQVANNLDIDLITQQVENGVLDVGRLSRWLAKLLKTHCAPMRDESAEAMAEQLEFGANTGDLSTLLNGLESLFSFLEAMKLDVANHQIRTFRYILIDETVSFQQNYFRKRIDDGRLNLAAAQAWYQDAYKHHLSQRNAQPKDHNTLCFEAFLHGLVGLCATSPNEQQHIPITLHYDQGRIQQLQADVQDFVILQLCIDVFNELLTTLRCPRHVPPLAYATLQSRLWTIADDETAQPGFAYWNERIAEIAIEITRAAYVACVAPLPPRIPADAFDRTQARLQDVFETCYPEAEAQMLSQLADETVRHAATFQKMSTMEMSEAQKQYQQMRQARGDLGLPDPVNMARMLAHMGVLHWKVWWDLAYMPDTDADADTDGPVSDFTGGVRWKYKNSMGFTANDGFPKASIESHLDQTWDNTQ